MIEAGAYPSPLNYYNFPKSVCTSVNEVWPKPTHCGVIRPPPLPLCTAPYALSTFARCTWLNPSSSCSSSSQMSESLKCRWYQLIHFPSLCRLLWRQQHVVAAGSGCHVTALTVTTNRTPNQKTKRHVMSWH